MGARVLCAAALAGVACTVEFDNDGPEIGVAVNHITAKGTHNSYHVAPDPPGDPEDNYTHAPLDEQAAALGVRQFELDVHYVGAGTFAVLHDSLDTGTTCPLLADCLSALKGWSDANPTHHPIMVMIELKDPFAPATAGELLAALENEISAVWPDDRLITPDLVRGEAATLRASLLDRGWPLIDRVRQRALFFILNTDGYDLEYSFDGTTLDGRLAFVEARIFSDPYAAISRSMPSPVIEQLARENILVRVRVDRVGPDGPEIDTDLLEAALARGAHFVSTDVATLELPGGAPSICNAVTALPSCDPAAIEAPP